MAQQNLEELRISIKKEEPVAAFIGAGCSSVLNIPRWTELISALNNELNVMTMMMN